MKTIMIQDTVYKDLAAVKGDKSFSELFEELLDEAKESKAYKMRLLDGILGTITREQADRSLAAIKKMRANFKVRV
jgi:predicted CopG family antitoxin